MQVGQRDQVDQDPHSVGVEKEFDVLSVVEEFVYELEEPVPLCAVLTLGPGGRGVQAGEGGRVRERRREWLV